MRIGVAHVDVRINMAQYKADLLRVERLARATTATVNSSFGKVNASYSRLSRSAGTTAGGMDKVTKATSKQKRGFMSLLPHVAMVTASYMAMRSAWRSFMSGLTAGVQFEQKMSVVKAVSRATAEEFIKLGDAAKKMAIGTVFTATQTADALKYLAMAGFEAEEAIAALPGVLNLALIGELELGRATDIATDTLRAFGLEAANLSRVNDVMVATITRSNTNIEMMGQSMKFAAPVAHALGYEIEQVAAMAGTLAQSGVKAGIAGRNLQQAFIRTTKAARLMGLEVGSNLIDVLKGYNEEQERLERTLGRLAAAEKMAERIRKDYGLIALKSILILKDNIEQYEKLADAAYMSAGEAAEAAMIMQDNVDAAFKRLKSVIANISVTVFDEYKTGLKVFIDDISEWLKNNTDLFASWATSIIAYIRTVVDTLHFASKGIRSLMDLLPEGAKGAAELANPFSKLRALMEHLKIMEKEGELPAKTRFYTIDEEGAPTPNIIRSFNEYIDAIGRSYNAMAELNDEKRKSAHLDEIVASATKKKLEAELERDLEYFLKEDERLLHAELVRKQYESAYAELAPNLKAAYDEAKKFHEYQEKIHQEFAWLKDLDKEGYKAVITILERQYKAELKTFKKFEKDVLKNREKTSLYSVKVKKGEVEKKIAIEKNGLEKTLDQYEKFTDDQKALLKESNIDRESIERDYQEKIALIKEEAAKKAAEKIAKEAATRAEQELKRFKKKIESYSEDLFYDIFSGQIDSFKGFLDEMEDLFLKTLSRIAAQAATKKIIIPIITSLVGSMGLSGLLPAGLGGGAGGVGGAGGGLGLAGMIPGIQSWLGSPIIGTAGGTGALSYLSWGQALGGGGLGALGYGTLGSMLGLPQGGYSGIGSAIGGGLGSMFGPLGTGIGAGLGGWIGSMFGGKGHRPHIGVGAGLAYGPGGFASKGMYGDYAYGGDEGYAYGKLRGRGNIAEARESLDSAVAEMFNSYTSNLNSIIARIPDVSTEMLSKFKFNFSASAHTTDVEGFVKNVLEDLNKALGKHYEKVMDYLEPYYNKILREDIILQIGGADAPIELRLRAINDQYDEYRRQLIDLGATTSELIWLEGQRNKVIGETSNALGESTTAWKNVAESIRKQIESLKISDLSPLPLVDQLQTVRDAIDAIYLKGSLSQGDVSNLQGLYSDLLGLGKEFYTPASTGQIWRDESIIAGEYGSLFNKVILSLENLASYADSMKSEYEIQVDQLKYLEQITYNTSQMIPAGSYQHGTDYVPHDMLAWIHRGERIIPEHATGQGQGEIHIHNHLYIDGYEIGDVMAKQTTVHPQLIKAIQEVN